jgi:hypothetical protein
MSSKIVEKESLKQVIILSALQQMGADYRQ